MSARNKLVDGFGQLPRNLDVLVDQGLHECQMTKLSGARTDNPVRM
jgi:hypothetical protein